jgi:hypothetical protein
MYASIGNLRSTEAIWCDGLVGDVQVSNGANGGESQREELSKENRCHGNHVCVEQRNLGGRGMGITGWHPQSLYSFLAMGVDPNKGQRRLTTGDETPTYLTQRYQSGAQFASAGT